MFVPASSHHLDGLTGHNSNNHLDLPVATDLGTLDLPAATELSKLAGLGLADLEDKLASLEAANAVATRSVNVLYPAKTSE